VSTRLLDDYGISGVCLSVPTRVGMHGVEGHVHLHLDAAEQSSLHHSADVLAGAISELSL
jgi:L-lactate dehydrogenase